MQDYSTVLVVCYRYIHHTCVSRVVQAHFESLRAAEAKNSATINQLKYRSRSCITANIALGAWQGLLKVEIASSHFGYSLEKVVAKCNW